METKKSKSLLLPSPGCNSLREIVILSWRRCKKIYRTSVIHSCIRLNLPKLKSTRSTSDRSIESSRPIPRLFKRLKKHLKRKFRNSWGTRTSWKSTQSTKNSPNWAYNVNKATQWVTWPTFLRSWKNPNDKIFPKWKSTKLWTTINKRPYWRQGRRSIKAQWRRVSKRCKSSFMRNVTLITLSRSSVRLWQNKSRANWSLMQRKCSWQEKKG
jgi:hypothetical protein